MERDYKRASELTKGWLRRECGTCVLKVRKRHMELHRARAAAVFEDTVIFRSGIWRGMITRRKI